MRRSNSAFRERCFWLGKKRWVYQNQIAGSIVYEPIRGGARFARSRRSARDLDRFPVRRFCRKLEECGQPRAEQASRSDAKRNPIRSKIQSDPRSDQIQDLSNWGELWATEFGGNFRCASPGRHPRRRDRTCAGDTKRCRDRYRLLRDSDRAEWRDRNRQPQR